MSDDLFSCQTDTLLLSSLCWRPRMKPQRLFLQEVFVNLDPVVLEVLQEARWMTKLGVTMPKVVLKLSSREAQIKTLYKR